jgi:hypothetical protein
MLSAVRAFTAEIISSLNPSLELISAEESDRLLYVFALLSTTLFS